MSYVKKNPKARNSGITVVMTMKRKLGMQRNSEKPHGNFQVPI
jgi:hypothetical protein